MGLLSRLKSTWSGAEAAAVAAVQALPSEALERCLAAGRALEEAAEGLAADSRSVLDVVLNGEPFAKWQLYPWQGGILDQRSASQYFYHSHEGYRGEHGHFHTFTYHQRKLVHLVAIGIDARGRINRLYTFNRWGPGDHYFPAQRLKEFLPAFRVGLDQPLDRRLHQFINETLVLFRPQIERLFEERDATFERYRAEHDGAEPYEDRSLEITSAVPADVATQLRVLTAERQRRGSTGASRAALPPAPAQLAATPAQAPSLAERSPASLERSIRAGRDAQVQRERLRHAGRTVVQAAMDGRAWEEWEMYPWDGGVLDRSTGSQWFYHSHPDSPEHGHFHLFQRQGKALVHLVAIAMDDAGEPISLFTVNRWVTDDAVRSAEQVAALMPRFRVGPMAFDPRVSDWLRGLLGLYEPEIGALLRQRDVALAAWRDAHGGAEPYEDRELEVTSSLEIRPREHLAALEAEFRRRTVS